MKDSIKITVNRDGSVTAPGIKSDASAFDRWPLGIEFWKPTDRLEDVGLTNANGVRVIVSHRYPYEEGYTFTYLGKTLGLSDEFVRSVLNGSREPSRAFTDATGFERVVLYRRSSRGQPK